MEQFFTTTHATEFTTVRSEYNLPDFVYIPLSTQCIAKITFNDEFEIVITTPNCDVESLSTHPDYVSLTLALKTKHKHKTFPTNAYIYIHLSVSYFQCTLRVKKQKLKCNVQRANTIFHYRTVCQSFNSDRAMQESLIKVQLECISEREQYHSLNGKIPRVNPYAQPCMSTTYLLKIKI